MPKLQLDNIDKGAFKKIILRLDSDQWNWIVKKVNEKRKTRSYHDAAVTVSSVLRHIVDENIKK